MKNQTWDTEYQSYRIRAINKGSVFSPKITKTLEINGILVKSIKGGFMRSCSTIFATYNFNGIDREIEVRFAQKTKNNSSVGCQFFIDGDKIGGDKLINYPDPIKSAKHLEKGFVNYLLSVGLLSYGLPISIGLGIIDLGSPLLIRVQRFIIYILLSSFTYSCFTWNQMKSMAEYRQNHNRSKN